MKGLDIAFILSGMGFRKISIFFPILKTLKNILNKIDKEKKLYKKIVKIFLIQKIQLNNFVN